MFTLKYTSSTIFCFNYLAENSKLYYNCHSNLVDIKIGVPQGLILGPLHFTLFIHKTIH